jgi:hypothetical protein
MVFVVISKQIPETPIQIVPEDDNQKQLKIDNLGPFLILSFF